MPHERKHRLKLELHGSHLQYLLPTPQQHTFPEESERAQELLARLNAALTVAG